MSRIKTHAFYGFLIKMTFFCAANVGLSYIVHSNFKHYYYFENEDLKIAQSIESDFIVFKKYFKSNKFLEKPLGFADNTSGYELEVSSLFGHRCIHLKNMSTTNRSVYIIFTSNPNIIGILSNAIKANKTPFVRLLGVFEKKIDNLYIVIT